MSNPVVYPQGATSTPIQIATGAQAEQVFTFPAAPAGSTWYLNFVVCSNPAANTSGMSPLLPKVDVVHDIVGPMYQEVKPNNGFQPIDAGDGTVDVELVNHPSGLDGVYQLEFSPEAQYTLSGAPWKIRWTNNNNANTIQVTFVVDSADTVLPWIAFALVGATDFSQASTLTPLSDAPTPPWTTPVQLICGQTYDLTVPIYNFGTAPLSINIAADITSGQFSVLATMPPITIPPGGANKLTVQLAPQSKPGAINSAGSPAVLTIPNPDTLHHGTLSFYATVGNMEFVFGLDVSGSMATVDVSMSRWDQLQAAMALVMAQLQHFANGGTWAALLYPSTQGSGNTQLIQAPTAITNTSSIDFTMYRPTNGTPMGPAIYVAMGQPGASPTTDCGQFLDNDPSKPQNQAGFQYDHRWLVLMTDGAANIGDDPATFASNYYSDRKVKSVTIGFGTGGQTNPATLQTIATNSGGLYIPTDPTAQDPLKGLATGFFKAVSAGLALNYAADPSAVLPATQGAKNQHSVILTEYDRKVGFVLTFLTEAEAQFAAVELIAPGGKQINPQTAASLGIAYAQGLLSKAYFVDFNTKLGRTIGGGGTWTIVVMFAPPIGIEARLSDSFFRGIRYAYQTVVDSDLTLHLGSGAEIHHAGDPILLSGALAVKGAPLQDASVKVQIIGAGQGFDNWLASQTVTDAEYKAALEALGTMHDIQTQFVKAFALSRKGINFFPGTGSTTVRTMAQNPRTGAYETTFGGTTLPGTYSFLVLANGFDEKGNLFQRQKTESIVVQVLPDEASTLVDLTYQVVGGQMHATLRFWLLDALLNLRWVDTALTTIVQVLLKGGATAAGPLRTNLDGSYTQIFTYPLAATPIISIVFGGNPVVPTLVLPEFGKLLFVDEVIDYKKGREAKPGDNAHAHPEQALGDPSQRLTQVSLGGFGSATYAIKGKVIHARAVTVFVGVDIGLRPYAVDLLAGARWIELGRSAGVTQTFSLLPRPKCTCADPKGSYIALEGKVFGDTFDVRVPLESRLREPPDPILGLGKKGIQQIRIRDLSNRVDPADQPGTKLRGIGFTP
jgi:hypothetical protein